MVHYHHNTKENNDYDNYNDNHRHCHRPDHHHNLHVALAGARGRGDQLDQRRGRGQLDQRGGNQHMACFSEIWIGNIDHHHKQATGNLTRGAYLILVTTATTGGGVLFSSWCAFCKDNAKIWPILAIWAIFYAVFGALLQA